MFFFYYYCIFHCLPGVRLSWALLLLVIPLGHHHHGQPVRYCFHPGSSSDTLGGVGSSYDGREVSSKEMLTEMMSYIWPKDDAMIRQRVMISMGLLVGAKILNVGVPFLFKAAVDGFGALSMNTAPDIVLASSVSLLLGCK